MQARSNYKICQYSRYSYHGYGSCSWCDAGKFIDDNAATTTKHDNQNDCGVCSEEKYREIDVQNTCKSCPAGTYNSCVTANAVNYDAHTDCKFVKVENILLRQQLQVVLTHVKRYCTYEHT